ncbi:MAG: YciI family protein [Dehalococcoidia bacterium]
MTTPARLDIPTNLRNYHLHLLVKGDRWSGDETPELGRLFAAHLAYVRQLVEQGKLIFAGPVTDNGFIRGMSVLATESLAEAEAICQADPAVQAGHYGFELHPASFAGLDGVRVHYPT